MPSSLNGTGVTFNDGTQLQSGAIPAANLGTGSPGSGNFLRGDRTWQSIPMGASNQTFTASGTFTVPAGVTNVKVTVFGGGGGASGSCDSGGRSGGRGGLAVGYVSVTPGASITVTVGAGGAGGGLCQSGGTGGTSSFGSTLSATGGQGGLPDSNAGANGVGSGTNLNAALMYATASFGSRTGGGSSAVAFSLGSATPPGSGGAGNSVGGVGGAVVVEW